jgi:predicted RNA-binding Zn-ribbon protein involved in translation (DUF1610 family)
MATRKISLKVITEPNTDLALDAPPILRQYDHFADYTCGRCGIILLHAEENRVHGILIRCANCGSYNSTDAEFAVQSGKATDVIAA